MNVTHHIYKNSAPVGFMTENAGIYTVRCIGSELDFFSCVSSRNPEVLVLELEKHGYLVTSNG